MQTKNVSLQDLNSARRSVDGRLRNLRRGSYRYGGDGQSPIKRIGVFSAEIDQLEDTLRRMQSRIDNAKITIEI